MCAVPILQSTAVLATLRLGLFPLCVLPRSVVPIASTSSNFDTSKMWQLTCDSSWRLSAASTEYVAVPLT